MMIEICTPTPDDLPDMYGIECRANDWPWSESLLASNFGERYHNGLLLVDGVAAGFYIADYVAGESNLMNISVDPAWQGKKLGLKLLEYYLAHTAGMGCNSWWLEVRLSNVKAQNLYEKVGYIQVGYRENYYASADDGEDALVLQRLL